MRQAFAGEDRIRFFIGDVRDFDRLRRAMDGCDVVVHAAALKRVEVGEYDSGEMVKTNVLGAMNVIEAAQDCLVEKVVALSTDKAFEPINAYGASKLLAEKLFLAANNARGAHGPRFSVTRYGNVAGSTGSVIPIWRELLAAGRMVTVRDPNATRFWMTLEQACQLVGETIATMKGGELVVPDLPAYTVGDLARALGVYAGPFTYTELGAGEKQHESMRAGNSSEFARYLSADELKEALSHV
jgi:UDP-N-acetylglucosamine 4,6-dehydratase